MKEIENEFIGKGEVSGVKFKLLVRSGLWTIWERSDGYYEVVRLIERKAGVGYFQGVRVDFEAKESYPSGESWSLAGKGKCVKSLDRAKNIFYGQLEPAG